MAKINSITVSDIRAPTSDTLLGSDPFHKKPNYSCVYTQIKLSNGIEGISVCFTSGAGNDWIGYGVNDIAKLLEDMDFSTFIQSPGQFCWGLVEAWISGDTPFQRKTLPYNLPRFRVQDIDTYEDWDRAELLHKTLYE